MTARPAYYNEIDPLAAAWLRALIDANHIAQGIVDERSIKDVTPADLAGFGQCHFFAGIGVWSAALRGAGWRDDEPVWTGSCPCQPFSGAGRGDGFDDERHLWPEFFRLIGECRPDVVFGEQVASKDGLAWLDLVHADMEGAGYAVGSADLCAAGVGAPHMRQRLYWVADNDRDGRDRIATARLHGRRHGASGQGSPERDADRARGDDAVRRREPRELEYPQLARLEGLAGHGNDRRESGRLDTLAARSVAATGDASVMADTAKQGRGTQSRRNVGADWRTAEEPGRLCPAGEESTVGPTHGEWGAADWLLCRDEKWRPVEPGTFPLAHGAPERVGRLRGYGNAIVRPLAQAFIEAYQEARAELDGLRDEGATAAVEGDAA